MSRARTIFVAIGLGGAAACGFDATLLTDPPVPAPTTSTSDGGDVTFADASPMTVVATTVSAGQYFSCALAHEQAFCWGGNALGALGTGDLATHATPTAVLTDARFAALALGENHGCGLEATTGGVLCWGAGASGQLGLGDTALHLSPQRLASLAPAAQITVGFNHSCAVLRDGSLWCWGENSESQLGQGPDDLANATEPRRVETASDWRMVAGGQGHTCGIREPGSLWCWGRNTTGQAGLGAGAPGRLVVPTRVGTADDWLTLEVGQGNACGIRGDGTLWCWGDTGTGAVYTPTRIGTDSDWTSVSTDVFTTCGIRAGGRLFCFGRNAEGQFGVGDTDAGTAPTATGTGAEWTAVAVGRLHVCAVTTAGSVRCSGRNDDGELGVGDLERRDLFTEVAVASESPVR